MHVFTDAALAARPVQWEKLHYTADEKDGRPAFGYAASCFSITRTVEAGETAQFEVVFFTGETAASGTELLRQPGCAGEEGGLRRPGRFAAGCGGRCLYRTAGLHQRQDHSGGLPAVQRLGPRHDDRLARLLPGDRPL